MWGYMLGAGFIVVVGIPAIRVGATYLYNKVRFKMRGSVGESMVDRTLRKFKGRSFARAKDVMVPFQNKTSQIDNILISRYGIFVIETKNYYGVIEGRERSPHWVQIMPGNRNGSREFYNPIWQNEGHIKALRNLLCQSYPTLPFYNLVAFSDRCRIPNVPGVINMQELRKVLKAEMQGEPILSIEDVANIKNIIEKANIKDNSTRAEHVTFAKNSALRAKEREKQEAYRERVLANSGMAVEVQNLYLRAREARLENQGTSLEEKIQSAVYGDAKSEEPTHMKPAIDVKGNCQER